MNRTRLVVVSLLSLILLVPAKGWAQAVQAFEDLALRVNLGDQLQIKDQSGVRATGRVIHLSRDEVAIRTDAGEKRFATDTVREVAVRSYPLRRGALVGTVVFAVLGAVATCSHEGDGDCLIIGTLGAAPIGAGVGLAMGGLVSRMKTIYRAPERGASPVTGAAGGVQASLLEDLALRVNLDDQLQVEDRSGSRTTGRLTGLTTDEITVRTPSGEKHFARETLRQVAVRRHPLRMAVLIGAAAGAVTGAVAACKGPDREECPDAPILAGGLGAGLGLAAGALVHTTAIVYPEVQRRATVLPLVSRDVVGVRVSLRW
jgi:hypothetical protein